MKVIIADDKLDLLKFAVATFKSRGHLVVGTAANGRDLVNCALENEHDIIFTDYQMPELDGLEAIKELRLQGNNRLAIINTGNIEELTEKPSQRRIEYGPLGKDGFYLEFEEPKETYAIAKPYSLSGLTELIKSILEKSQR